MSLPNIAQAASTLLSAAITVIAAFVQIDLNNEQQYVVALCKVENRPAR